ncbi:hypothetical protein V6N12_052591 [Hibiscus sabdariffa]|uniref:Secreted protein n=1 Tax=Hibiscus sabdariffa TaxID=183260 RepID=A0ABR2C294_9ROSI
MRQLLLVLLRWQATNFTANFSGPAAIPRLRSPSSELYLSASHPPLLRHFSVSTDQNTIDFATSLGS